MSDQLEPPVGASGNFGEELRKEREIRGITLKEIADSTKISKRFLEAIEKNDFKTLPAPIFTRGFIREYSRYLGLPADDMLNRYAHYVRQAEAEENAPLQTGPIPVLQTRPVSNIPPSYARLNRNLVYAGLLILGIGSILWFVLQRRQTDSAEAVDPRQPATETTQERIQPPTTAASAAAPVTAVAPTAGLSLRLDFIETSWISLEADGKSVLNDEVKAGQSRTFSAEEGFRFRTIGNAAGVIATLNGTKLPSFGETGEVVKNRIVDRRVLAERGIASTTR